MKCHETIIIGGGISGLACARTLTDNNKDFLLITKDVGGRILTSKSGTVNYGAIYLTTEYKNVLKFADKGDRLLLKDAYFAQEESVINAFSFLLTNVRNLPKLIKVVYLVDDFARRFLKFRERALIKNQKEALKEDEILEDYTKMSALQFVKKHKIEYLHEKIFHPILQGTIFAEANRCNAFYYLTALIPLVRKTYYADFRYVIPRSIQGFKRRAVIDEVISLKKNGKNQYLIKTKNERYAAKNVVIAAPYEYAQKFYPVHKTGPVVSLYTIHILGKRKEVYQNKKILVLKPKHRDVAILWRQYDGSDIMFSKTANPNLKKYYKNHRIIKTVHWKNALSLSGPVDNWVEQQLDKNLYLASDYNICGLEDAAVTGVYAAKQIIKASTKT